MALPFIFEPIKYEDVRRPVGHGETDFKPSADTTVPNYEEYLKMLKLLGWEKRNPIYGNWNNNPTGNYIP